MATIRDVAKKAGVAISTVSVVLNRSAPVSADAVLRVENAIAAVGYVPHGAAQSLRSGRSRFIGLVVPNIANPHFAAVAREIENVCLAAGYASVVYSTGQDARRESQVLTMMRVQRVAGLIVIPAGSDAAHGAALAPQIHVPTVLLDMYVEGLPYDVVKTDNLEAGRLAAEHLLALGHRQIGVVVGIPGLATSDDRLAGFLNAFAERGLTHDPALRVVGRFDQHAAHQAAIDLLSRSDNRPSALVSLSNMMTTGLLFAIRELGLVVPAELSIVGIDDLDFAELLDPKPTVVTTPVLPMARRAIQKLLDELDGAKPSGRWENYQPQLLVRQSTAPAR